MICVLQATRRYLKYPPLSPFSPLWGNNKLPPRRNDGGFKIWADKGLAMMKDVHGRDGRILSFEQMVSKCNIPHKHFYKYVQLRNFIRSYNTNFPHIPNICSKKKILAAEV